MGVKAHKVGDVGSGAEDVARAYVSRMQSCENGGCQDGDELKVTVQSVR
jgi:hypothetical protein